MGREEKELRRDDTTRLRMDHLESSQTPRQVIISGLALSQIGMLMDRVRAIIIDERKVLLVTSQGASKYWSPGGHQNKSESHQRTLERELMEELNLKLKDMRLIVSLDSESATEEGCSHYYLCTTEGKQNRAARYQISSG